jgi:hypothetical protein
VQRDQAPTETEGVAGTLLPRYRGNMVKLCNYFASKLRTHGMAKYTPGDYIGLDEVQEIPQDFEIDLHNLVVANHSFTMEAIDKSEDEDL